MSHPASDDDGDDGQDKVTEDTPLFTLTGVEVIAAEVKKLPLTPGVYRMLDAAGDVLYVGKAKSLKKRVMSYTKIDKLPYRIARMVSLTRSMMFVNTASETEALLLEANLIKRLKPRFNVLLRDDKSFPYLVLTRDHVAPRLLKHRGARSLKGDYFGPFASSMAVNSTLQTLQRAFLLRTCSDAVYSARTRPCLLYQLKRCAAPCTGEISLDAYGQLADDAVAFLRGKSQNLREQLAQKMEAAAEALLFEEASVYRDRLKALSHVQARQGINPQTVVDADVFAVHVDMDATCVEVFFFRSGQNWGNRTFFPRADKTIPIEEMLSSFLAQFYQTHACPPLVLVSHKPTEHVLLEDALTHKTESKVVIHAPERGEKYDLVQHALQNAKAALARRLADTGTHARLLAEFAKEFKLEETPQRIEIYDNSHISGTHAIGAMVVVGSQGFDKSHYRKFNIKSTELTPGDDFAMMREVLTRRFSRLLKQSDATSQDRSLWPDVVIIDGGAGQLSAVQQVFDDLGVEGVVLMAIAKGEERNAGRETFHLAGRKPFMLPARHAVLHFLQRLRDEAHRFAVGTHVARRKIEAHRSPLDEIEGIGAARKRALLRHFGSAKEVAQASLIDLQKVRGVHGQLAKKIYDFFHEQNS